MDEIQQHKSGELWATQDCILKGNGPWKFRAPEFNKNVLGDPALHKILKEAKPQMTALREYNKNKRAPKKKKEVVA